MLYNIPFYFIYFLLAALLLLCLQLKSYRWIALLIPSLLIYFFLVKEQIIILLLFSLVIYFGARINFTKTAYRCLLAVALSPLLFYKLSGLFSNNMNISSLLGLSFFTFNGISYLIDVRRKYTTPEKNYGVLLLYLCYIPHLFSGPLHRIKYLIPQFKESIRITNENCSNGFRLVLWGIFKNYVLAQNLKIVLDSISTHEHYKGLWIWFSGLLFFFQLYCDFSSYVDISRGISQIFGITLQNNFANRIYTAKSRKEFWNGWHITLNNWFRDYFFFVITKRVTKRWMLNLSIILTFMLIGLWHDSTYLFLLWGIVCGIWLITERYATPFFNFIPDRIRNPLGLIYHLGLSSLVTLLFRGIPLSKTLSVFSIPDGNIITDIVAKKICIVVVAFVIMDYIYIKAGKKNIDEYIGSKTTLWRWSLYLLLALLIFNLGMIPNANFFYFQF